MVKVWGIIKYYDGTILGGFRWLALLSGSWCFESESRYLDNGGCVGRVCTEVRVPILI